MGEFENVDPSEFAKSIVQKRDQLQREQQEAARTNQEKSAQEAGKLKSLLEDAEARTVELFDFLRKGLAGQKMSDNHDLVVERTGSRPEGKGCRMEEKPPWILIRASGTTTNPRHKPVPNFSTPEYVLATRGGLDKRYELCTYPTSNQDRTEEFDTDDLDELLTRIREEIAGR